MSTAAVKLIDAFLAGDAPGAASHLAPDATFHSPIRDYAGAGRIAAVWEALSGVVTGARTTSVHERGGETVAFFAGSILDAPVDGVLRTVSDERGDVRDVTLMLRPWAALKAGLARVSV